MLRTLNLRHYASSNKRHAGVQCRLPGYAQSEEEFDNNTIIPLHLFEMVSDLLLHWSFLLPSFTTITYFFLSIRLSFFLSFPFSLFLFLLLYF